MTRALQALLLLCLALSRPADAAVALVDNPGGAASGGASSITLSSVTLTGGTLLVCLTASDANTTTVASITWNTSEPLGKLTHRDHSGTAPRAELWYRVNPTLTTANVVGTFSTGDEAVLKCLTFSGVNTADPFGGSTQTGEAGAGDTSLSTTVTVPTGGMAVDVIAKSNSVDMNVGNDQTQVMNLPDGTAMRGAMSTSTLTGSNPMNWTFASGQTYTQIATALQPTAAASAVDALMPLVP